MKKNLHFHKTRWREVYRLAVLFLVGLTSFPVNLRAVDEPRPDIAVRYNLDFDKKMQPQWVGFGIYDTVKIARLQERLVDAPAPSATAAIPWLEFYFSIFNRSPSDKSAWIKYVNTCGIKIFDSRFKDDPRYWEYKIFRKSQNPSPGLQTWVDVTK